MNVHLNVWHIEIDERRVIEKEDKEEGSGKGKMKEGIFINNFG